MKAIRGAVTVAADTPEEIRGAVDSLLSEIRKRNKINVEDIVCIMLSSTGDITSLYPAKAARECGFAGGVRAFCRLRQRPVRLVSKLNLIISLRNTQPPGDIFCPSFHTMQIFFSYHKVSSRKGGTL